MVNAIANPQMPEKGERFLGTVVKTTTVRRVRVAAAGQGRPAAHLRRCASSSVASAIENVEDVLSVGQKVQVEIKEIDPRGKLVAVVATAVAVVVRVASPPRAESSSRSEVLRAASEVIRMPPAAVGGGSGGVCEDRRHPDGFQTHGEGG
jgi:polyribonucleotide nucleotidyltransferase